MDALPPDPAAQDDAIASAAPLLPLPIPPAASVLDDGNRIQSPALSRPDAAFLEFVGRIVAGLVVSLGIASTGLCIYVLYRAIIWLWFTP
ncbi:MAG: hypothetical protein NTU53_16025 [Planctomycetota bacterium]|nr:hypothetical protein [Planctomycetota bacterium]